MQQILLGIDGSAESLSAVRWVVGLSRLCEIEVVAVAVYGFAPAAGMAGPDYYVGDEWSETLLQDVRSNLEGPWTAALREANITYTTVVEEGRPVECLLELAEERHPDLIVVGSRGRGAVKELLMGSVSHALALRAPCPVVVIPPHLAAAAPHE